MTSVPPICSLHAQFGGGGASGAVPGSVRNDRESAAVGTHVPCIVFTLCSWRRRYISEAHASDEWPLGTRESRLQHKSIDDRLEAARHFVKKYGWKFPTVVDSMTNSFAETYGAWPERYCIFRRKRLEVLGLPTTEWGYDRQLIANYVRTWAGANGECLGPVASVPVRVRPPCTASAACEERKTDEGTATVAAKADAGVAASAADAGLQAGKGVDSGAMQAVLQREVSTATRPACPAP